MKKQYEQPKVELLAFLQSEKVAGDEETGDLGNLSTQEGYEEW